MSETDWMQHLPPPTDTRSLTLPRQGKARHGMAWHGLSGSSPAPVATRMWHAHKKPAARAGRPGARATQSPGALAVHSVGRTVASCLPPFLPFVLWHVIYPLSWIVWLELGRGSTTAMVCCDHDVVQEGGCIQVGHRDMPPARKAHSSTHHRQAIRADPRCTAPSSPPKAPGRRTSNLSGAGLARGWCTAAHCAGQGSYDAPM